MRGFSFIELLIVVAIIGILGSIAIPAYKDHVTRAKVVELLALAEPSKLAVTEALISGASPSEINNTTLGLPALKNKGRVKEISITNGIVTITGDPKALDIPETTPFTIALTPKTEGGVILWECKTNPAEMSKFSPANCR